MMPTVEEPSRQVRNHEYEVNQTMRASQKVARTSAGIAFLITAVVAGISAGMNGVSPQGPGEITQLMLFVLLASAVTAAVVYAGVSLATKNTNHTSEETRS